MIWRMLHSFDYVYETRVRKGAYFMQLLFMAYCPTIYNVYRLPYVSVSHSIKKYVCPHIKSTTFYISIFTLMI